MLRIDLYFALITRVTMLAGMLMLVTLLSACGGQPVKQSDKGQAAPTFRVDSSVEEKFDSAIVALNAGDFDTAIGLLAEVVTAEKRIAAPFVNLGMAYARKGNNKKAEENLRKAVELDATHPVANNELGMLYRKLGQFDDARQAYEKALAAHPDYLPAIKNLGILCDIYLHDTGCAIKQYEQFLEHVPDDKTVGIWVADIKRRAGQ